MTLTETQGSIWKMVTQVYRQWDPDGTQLMPESELQNLLPAVPGDVLDDTLEHAAQDQLAELRSVGDDRAFRPLPR